MMDIIFFDKDRTLGNFIPGECNLYTGVPNFLDDQIARGRQLYVTTTSGQKGIKHLEAVMNKFKGYFGSDQINASKHPAYILPDGSIRTLQEDYTFKILLESEERRQQLNQEAEERGDKIWDLRLDIPEKEAIQKEINTFFDYWHTLVHKETQEPFDQSTLYQNPNFAGSHTKDLHLARRLISPKNYDLLRTSMVGDYGDKTSVTSDPQTPLIMISSSVRKGNWRLVTNILDTLFSDENSMPWEIYENIFSQAPPDEKGDKSFSLEGNLFVLEKGKHQERRIYCP